MREATSVFARKTIREMDDLADFLVTLSIIFSFLYIHHQIHLIKLSKIELKSLLTTLFILDASTCDDVCDHHCDHQSAGAPTCACYRGYYLASDEITCIGNN